MADAQNRSPIGNRPSLTSELIDWFRGEISSGKLSPGDKLPTEHEIVRKMAVSRTVVREAVSALKADGLVYSRRGVGAFVADPSQIGSFKVENEKLKSLDNVLHLLELRIGIETEMAGLAAARRTEDQVAKMREYLAEIDRLASQHEDSAGADLKLHLAIADATGNPYYLDLFNYLGGKLVPPRSLVVERDSEEHEAYVKLINGEHAALVDSIAAGDPVAAREAAWTHLTNSRNRHEQQFREASTPAD